MKSLVVVIFLFCAVPGHAQQAVDIIKSGSVLMYRLDVGDKHYDMEATVINITPFEYRWRIADSANAEGIVHNTMAAMEKGTVILNNFMAGDKTLDDNTTALIISKNIFRSAGKKRKPSIQLKEGAEKMKVGIIHDDSDFKVNINGSPAVISHHTLKPVVKIGLKYIPTGTEMISVYDFKNFPLVLKMRSTFYLELLAIR